MKNLGNRKKLLFLIISVFFLIISVAGVSYAYFAATATSEDYISGGAAAGDNTLKLEIEQVSDGEGELIPQLDTAIGKAITGATGKGTCIDDNGNTICKVYSIKITNQSSVKTNVTGTLQLTANGMNNLKWAKGTSATSGFPTPEGTYYTKNDTALAEITLEATGTDNASQTFYVVIWISEIDAPQTDQNSFTGTVTFNSYTIGSDGERINGITSTFTG